VGGESVGSERRVALGWLLMLMVKSGGLRGQTNICIQISRWPLADGENENAFLTGSPRKRTKKSFTCVKTVTFSNIRLGRGL